LRPGDDYNARTAWSSILEPNGWRRLRVAADGNEHWARPGKAEAATSATVSNRGEGVLYVFSTEATPFVAGEHYDRFGAYAVLHHHGDRVAAAHELRQMGFGASARKLHETTPRGCPDWVREPQDDTEDGRAGDWTPPDEPELNREAEWRRYHEGGPAETGCSITPEAKLAAAVKASGLEVLDVADVAAEVDSAPPVGFLLRPVWPADAYGVMAAEDKAGKTWASLDAGVSVASGTPWLGRFACETPGPVLIFVGEGGKRKMVRRLRAISAARGLILEDLPVRLCFKVPHLTSPEHLAVIAAELASHPACLVIIDPLYLAARGAQGSDLYEMGGHLEAVQHVVQQARAALMVIHHWNKTGQGKGASRMSGVGPGAWGRVLVSASIESRHIDRTTGESAVTLDLAFTGDEIPETDVRIRRKVWTDDLDDLSSRMHYEVEELALGAPSGGDDTGLRPSYRRVLAALAVAGTWLTVAEIGDRVAVDETGMGGLKARTIQDACKALAEQGMTESAGSPQGFGLRWSALVGPERSQPSTTAHGTAHAEGYEEGENGS